MNARPFPTLLVPLLILLAAAGALADQTVVLERALVLGPLPAGPPAADPVVPRGEVVPVPEWPVTGDLPRAGQAAALAAEGTLAWEVAETLDFPAGGVYWLAARLRTASFAPVTLALEGGTGLHVHGHDPVEGSGTLTAEIPAPRGWLTVFARIEGGGVRPVLTATAPEEADPVWILEPPIAFTRFEDTALTARAADLAVGPGGGTVARVKTRRADDLESLDVFDARGRHLAARVGGPGTRPVAFTPDGGGLLLRRPGDEGTDLLLMTLPSGPVRTVLENEPDLGLVRIHPDGRRLLLASSRGFAAADAPDGPGRLYTNLRERVIDWAPEPHLHLVDLETGARRRLTRPGDFTLDDAVFAADGRTVYYGRTGPIEPRPWFATEIRRLDLATGADEPVTTFTAGWEVRPQHMACDPEGGRLVFLGPPREYGPDGPEMNVYNKQVWLLDLATGESGRITAGLDLAFEAPGGLPRFDAEGRLIVQGTRGSRAVLVRLAEGDHGWTAEVLPTEGEHLESLAISPDGGHLAYASSGPDRPATLYRGEVGGRQARLEDLNPDLGGRVAWAAAAAASFTGPDGDAIEAWFYPPLQMESDGAVRFGAPAVGRAPLIVYYYGGANPTMRGFDTTHQFFAANGYGVLVVNSRGAVGYGDAFADHHAGDWGARGSADILAGVDHVLAEYAWLDPQAVGIYGGSYGGFMTQYLVTETDRFAAAVSMYGISDLATYWGQGTWGWTYGDMALGGADPAGDPGYFNRISPLYRADRVRTPLLLLHGEEDTNVTPGESVQMFTALSLRDQPVAMVLFPGEDHGISGTWENRVGHRTMMLEWFDRHCRGRPAAWEARWK